MHAIRRLYLYAVAFVSIEVVLWGLIGLVRSILAGEVIGGEATRLAGALSLILVGLPVFLLHWLLAQRSAHQDLSERSAGSRAVFLYGILLATLVPAVQNGLALLNRLLLRIFGLDPILALVGRNQTASDNLIAIGINGLVAIYMFSVLRQDWQAPLQGDAYPVVRRIYRYLWVIYGLGLVVFGAQRLIQYVLEVSAAIGPLAGALLVNGLALLLAGIPVLLYAWSVIESSLLDPQEQSSLLRLAVLYTLVFVSVGSVLASASLVVELFLRILLGEETTPPAFLQALSQPLSVALPLGGVWAYFGRRLNAELASLPDTPRRSALRRLYYYVLALLGLVATFVGLHALLSFLVDALMSDVVAWGDTLRVRLSMALATLLVGLPLWIVTWRPMVLEAERPGEAGDHARRSVVRKGYLFLIIFVSLMGVMFTSGALLFQLLSTLLGEPPDRPQLQAVQLFIRLALFAVFLAYHWQALRSDARQAASALARRHSLFPVLVLAPDNGDFAAQVVAALQRQAPAMPVAVHSYSLGAPDETLSAAKAVILPAELVARPSEALRLWLQGFRGERLVVPTPAKDWRWVSSSGQRLPSLADRAALEVRHLAEGEEIAPPRESSPWITVVYILAGLFVLQLILIFGGLIASFVLR